MTQPIMKSNCLCSKGVKAVNYTKNLRYKIVPLALISLMLFLAACNSLLTSSPPASIYTPISIIATPSRHPLAAATDRTTTQLAADYLSAIVNSDRTTLSSLIGADAWCTTPDSSGTVKKHLEEFSSAQIRNIRVEELNISGWVAYPPGAEAARISFEYQKADGQGWVPASMVVVTVQSPNTKTRFICNVTD